MQSEHNCISNKRYIKYQLHVSAIIHVLAIIMLYSAYQVAVHYMWYIQRRRDPFYDS